MKLRSGKIFNSLFKEENKPFKLILLKEKKENMGLYRVDINFDEASREWRKNKIHLGEQGFKYK